MEAEWVDEFANVQAMGVDGAREWAEELAHATAPARAAVERMEQLPPGPELIAELMATKPLFCDTPLDIRRTALWAKADAWMQAQRIEAMSHTICSTTDDLHQAVVIDVAKLTNQSEATVSRQSTLAQRVGAKLGEAWVALNAGLIGIAHLLVLDEVLRYAKPKTARVVLERVLPVALAKHWTPAQLKRHAKRVLIELDPLGSEQRARDAKHAESGVTMRPGENQMATMHATGDAWTVRKMMDEVNRRADAMQRGGDKRSLGERQIDALAAALLDEPETTAGGGATRPKRATAHVIVPMKTLLGGDKPGWLDGYGAITPSLARQIAKDADFRRLVLDPLSGKPVDVGQKGHDLSEEMRRYVDAVDRTCRMPGCSIPAHFCDRDHAVEWPEGPTTCDNCGLLCRRHHGVKTRKLYKLTRDGERNVTWLSPFGFEWHLDAATYEEFLDDDDAESKVGADPDPPPADLPLPPEPPDDDELEVDDLARRICEHARLPRAS